MGFKRDTNTFRITIQTTVNGKKKINTGDFDIPLDTVEIAREWIEGYMDIIDPGAKRLHGKVIDVVLIKEGRKHEHN